MDSGASDFSLPCAARQATRQRTALCHATRGDDDFPASMIKRTARSGMPREEADFLSCICFDHAFTDRLVELGRGDAKASSDRFLKLLTCDPVAQER